MPKAYCCKNCSNPLFLDVHVGQHNAVEKKFDSKQQCQIFIKDKLQWMNFDGQEGQILCPKCQAKLGRYVWHGDTCSCGNLVIPYIAFIPSKINTQEYQ
ncbi:Dual_specificity phosphatase [Hexamita inflata]|uniref:protein-tyrosine-phosphatase n=1 Tax=Hexamita inflata TaxID=28002 RepID=A0ABP1HKU7_9EUKA